MQQRQIAYEILCASLIDGQYANLIMRRKLNALPYLQRPFATELVNGVLRHLEELKAQFLPLTDKCSKKNVILLAMALYERFFMKTPDYVLYSLYPALCQRKGDGAFISALLHRIDHYADYESEDDESLAIHYSLPLWIVKMLKKQYSDDCIKLLEKLNMTPQVFYRINPLKFNATFKNDHELHFLNNNVFTSKENLLNTPDFHAGAFYIQDINAAKIVDYLDLKKGMKLLDVCSAPGSKLFNCLDLLNEEDIYANDLAANRLELVKKAAAKLGYSRINYLNHDGRALPEYLDMTFDRILLDVPCSGLGVLKRKADLRYHLQSADIDDLLKIQEELLEAGSKLLKSDGIMVYATCTLNKNENQRQIKNFLQRHDDFLLQKEHQYLFDDNGDAFYVAKLEKL